MEVFSGVTEENVEEVVGYGTRIEYTKTHRKAPQQAPEGENNDSHNRPPERSDV